MFINISNHPSVRWSRQQRLAAEEYGEIVDLSFPAIPAVADTKEVADIVNVYFQKVREYNTCVVMVQGEFVFTHLLVSMLHDAGIRSVAACTERVVEEAIDEEGNVVKKSEFRFIRFRDYYCD